MTKDHKYMELAYARARFSKDTSTKVGAIIIGPSMEDRASGYNGAPRGCKADEAGDARGTARPEKYFWFSHAELNAITNAARVGVPLEGCTIYVTHPPCMDCARAIVQAGIKRVVTVEQGADFYERWKDHILRSRRLFSECGVEFEVLSDEDNDQFPVRDAGGSSRCDRGSSRDRETTSRVLKGIFGTDRAAED